MAGTIATVAAGAAAWALSVFNIQIPLGLPHSSVKSELGPLLSAHASILLPGSAGFAKATDRWQAWEPPSFDVVVQVTSEQDIEQTIKYANEHGKPFLGITGGHGGNTDIGRFNRGLGIWLRNMNGITISEDGESATIGGGALSGEVVHTLWPQGKQTVTGACECTGFVAPMLGGGHGWLQGRHGLMADNLISARMVLANGSTITVSDHEHADLFWGLRGAGHNFGIVTEVQYKLYDRTPENELWSWEEMTFLNDQMESVFEVANRMLGGSIGEQPVEMNHWAYFMNVPAVDPTKPVVVFYLFYQGVSTIPQEYATPLHDLKPINTRSGTSDLPGLAKVGAIDYDSPICQHGSSFVRLPVALQSYNINGLRLVMDLLGDLPSVFNNSATILEAYSLHGVQAVPEQSTAYPDRENNLLLSPFIVYAPDPALDKEAVGYGKQMQETLVNASGKPLNAYVNYASGYESQEAVYGYDGWRLETLKKLKQEYDPLGRFDYFAPIKLD